MVRFCCYFLTSVVEVTYWLLLGMHGSVALTALPSEHRNHQLFTRCTLPLAGLRNTEISLFSLFPLSHLFFLELLGSLFFLLFVFFTCASCWTCFLIPPPWSQVFSSSPFLSNSPLGVLCFESPYKLFNLPRSGPAAHLLTVLLGPMPSSRICPLFCRFYHLEHLF